MKKPLELEEPSSVETSWADKSASEAPDTDQPGFLDRMSKAAGLPIIENGPLFWRSLEELAGDGSCGAAHGAEPATLMWAGQDSLNRRDLFRLMAASVALGAASGCAYQAPESIVPYVQAPESLIPGKPQSYTSLIPVDGYAFGVIVKSDMGRPIKIEGNPDHPASLGAADAPVQASLLTLYDPDRSKLVMHNGRVDTWDHFQTLALNIRQELRIRKGAGLRILTGTVTSPTLAGQLRLLSEQFPEARWHSYEPIMVDAVRGGCKLAFGEDVEPIYHFERAEVILALDADFLGRGPARLAAARICRSSRARPGAGIRHDEPSICRRVYAKPYRCGGRSPAGASGSRHRAFRQRARPGSWPDGGSRPGQQGGDRLAGAKR